jgi:hypothetical protein
MDLQYTSAFHVATPYGNDAGLGWGVGAGTVMGERLAGVAEWSNQPDRRGDGTMLPNVRGVITTKGGAEVFFSLTGRTVWVDREGSREGRQLLLTLFESEDDRYSWLNNTVCVAEGVIDPELLVAHLEVGLCISDRV